MDDELRKVIREKINKYNEEELKVLLQALLKAKKDRKKKSINTKHGNKLNG